MRSAFATLLVLSQVLVLFAQGPESANVRGQSTTTRKRLVEAEQKIANGSAAEALDELLKILDDAGNDLVTPDGKSFISARHYVHQFLARLPAELLTRYRDRVEEPAAELLKDGQLRRDPVVLHKLLDRYALSRPAEAARLLLAELAMERGDYTAAERNWRALLPLPNPVYPGAKTSPADLRAWIILATILSEDRMRAAELLEKYAKDFPDANGKLAGSEGLWTELLQQLLNQPQVNKPPVPDADWVTLGGSSSRSGLAGGTVPRNWPVRPTWKTAIPTVGAGWNPGSSRSPSVGGVKRIAFHPVVLGESVYLTTAGSVYGFDRLSGRIRTIFNPSNLVQPTLSAESLRVPSLVDADYSLSASDGKLYLRYGSPELFPTGTEGVPAPPRPSLLLCLDPSLLEEKRALVWKRFPPVPNDIPASWEGAPIVENGTIYAVFVRNEGGRTIHALACYRDSSERPLWVTDLCESTENESGTRNELLTRAGRNLIYCSHSGVIAAVQMDSGAHAWSYRYPRIRRYPSDGRHRDISPAVAADSRVFVAPNDADQLFAFDTESGELLWNAGPILIDHLIGASAGKVVAAIAGPQRGIRAYDAVTGSCDFPRGWKNHDDPFLPSYGRGFVSDHNIYWPTSAALYVIRLIDGTVAAQPVRGPHGNLAYAHGTLVVATHNELWGYVGPTNQPELPTPKPVLLGKLKPFPRITVEQKEKISFLPSTGKSLSISPEPVTKSQPRINFSSLNPQSESIRLLRLNRDQIELVDARGQAKLVTPPHPDQTIWTEDQLVSFDDKGVTLFDPSQNREIWSKEIPGIQNVIPIPSGIVCLVRSQSLVALHLSDGSEAWVMDTTANPRIPYYVIESAPRFLNVFPFAQRLLIHRSDQTRWLVDAANGKILNRHPSVDRMGQSLCTAFDPQTIAVSDGMNRLTLIDHGGRSLWNRTLGHEASLAGPPISVVRCDTKLLAIVSRNHGMELELLSLFDGSSLWHEPAMIPTEQVNPAAIGSNEQFVFVPGQDRLWALKSDTGKEAWSTQLPHKADWTALVTRRHLLLYPQMALYRERSDLLGSFLRFPKISRLPGLMHTGLTQGIDGIVPLLVIEPETGKIVDQREIPAIGPVFAAVHDNQIHLAAGGTIYRIR